MGHVGHRLSDERRHLGDIGGFKNLRVTGERADAQCLAVVCNARQLIDVIDVDEYFGRGKTHVQCGHEALATGKDARVIAVLVEEVEDLVEIIGTDIGEWCGFQPASPFVELVFPGLRCRPGTAVF